VVDVLTDPESAESSRVLTTPTVVREAPAPVRRVTGDLSDVERVVFALDLTDAFTDSAETLGDSERP
jgi:circadian clock protein KaiB